MMLHNSHCPLCYEKGKNIPLGHVAPSRCVESAPSEQQPTAAIQCREKDSYITARATEVKRLEMEMSTFPTKNQVYTKAHSKKFLYQKKEE